MRLEKPELSEARKAKGQVELEEVREQARRKTCGVQEHVRHVRHKSTFDTRHEREKTFTAQAA